MAAQAEALAALEAKHEEEWREFRERAETQRQGASKKKLKQINFQLQQEESDLRYRQHEELDEFELVAVSQSDPRKILFAHRQGPTGFSSLFDEYKPEEEEAFVAYLESEARPVDDEKCVQDYLDAADKYEAGLSEAQRAQEEEAASKAVEMEERTRVGIQNGGPLASTTVLLETGYRDHSPSSMNGAGEFATS